MTVADRFWAKVQKTDDCWLWTGSRKPHGYGELNIGGKAILAHRVSWLLHNQGTILSDQCVCHRCDNPTCVRPDHLFLGTQAENLADMRAKGRAYVEPKHTHCKRGHAFTLGNTYMSAKGQVCRECMNAPRRKGIRKPYTENRVTR